MNVPFSAPQESHPGRCGVLPCLWPWWRWKCRTLVEAEVESHPLWRWRDADVGKRHEGRQGDEEESWEGAWQTFL